MGGKSSKNSESDPLPPIEFYPEEYYNQEELPTYDSCVNKGDNLPSYESNDISAVLKEKLRIAKKEIDLQKYMKSQLEKYLTIEFLTTCAEKNKDRIELFKYDYYGDHACRNVENLFNFSAGKCEPLTNNNKLIESIMRNSIKTRMTELGLTDSILYHENSDEHHYITIFTLTI